MKMLFVLPMMLLIISCTQNHFNVPVDNFIDKVRVLGVAPIMIDPDSEIKHPQKEELIPIVADMNRMYELQFVRKLKGTGNFYTVALLEGEPRQIFADLFFRREKRDDATIRYNKYFWKNGELRDYLRKYNLDAVMFIMVSGRSMTDKIYSSNLFDSMTSDYNYLIMTAQILDGEGNILWEYPNFRDKMLKFDPLFNLQYPDFSEASANLAAETNVKFKTIDGIKRALMQKKKDLLLRETAESEIYGKQFNEMLSLLKYDQDRDRKDPPILTEKPMAPKGNEPQQNAPLTIQPSVTVPASSPPNAPTQHAVPASVAAPPPAPAIEPPPAPIAPAPPVQPVPATEPQKPEGS